MIINMVLREIKAWIANKVIKLMIINKILEEIKA